MNRNNRHAVPLATNFLTMNQPALNFKTYLEQEGQKFSECEVVELLYGAHSWFSKLKKRNDMGELIESNMTNVLIDIKKYEPSMGQAAIRNKVYPYRMHETLALKKFADFCMLIISPKLLTRIDDRYNKLTLSLSLDTILSYCIRLHSKPDMKLYMRLISYIRTLKGRCNGDTCVAIPVKPSIDNTSNNHAEVSLRLAEKLNDEFKPIITSNKAVNAA